MILSGDCLERLRELPDNSVDSVVTDPPYGLSFMGKKWDYDVPSVDIWREVLRVLKPGGHLLAFAGTRTYHRMAVNIEDAGFEIRDSLSWLYGSGFPKSHNISKAIDKAAGAEREVIGTRKLTGKARVLKGGNFDGSYDGKELTNTYEETAPATDAAKQWDGWGTALKPAHEPICLAQKPISEKTIAANVLKWGVGGLNIDGTRIEMNGEKNPSIARYQSTPQKGNNGWDHSNRGADFNPESASLGRFPSNLLLGCAPTCTDEAHDMFECPIFLLDGQSGTLKSGNLLPGHKRGDGPNVPYGGGGVIQKSYGGDSGGASRFFYCAKASKRERNEGCEGLPEKMGGAMSGVETRPDRPPNHTMRANHHPTVKPIALMRYLVRLVTPPNGTVLDPFTGSGSTGVAALKEGFKFIGVERESEYVEIAKARMAAHG